MSEFYSILTAKGLEKVAALVAGETITLSQMVFGNSTSIPYEDQTELGGEKHRCDLVKVVVDSNHPNTIIAEAIIKSDVGGFWIREVGIIDSDGDLFAVGKYPATYKPLTDEGSVKELGVRMILAVTNAGDVVVTYNNGIMDGAANTNLDNLTFAGQQKFDEKAPILSPNFTGLPRAPTALMGANTTQIANVHWVNLTIAALVNSAPATLDTLKELSAALGDDPNFATTITNLLANKASNEALTELEGIITDALAGKLSLGGGTMTGNIIATSTNPNNAFAVRNIKASTIDPGVGSPLPDGNILLIYDE